MFFFPSFSAFPNLYWLEKLPKWWFLFFWIVLLFFGIFYYELGRNSSERFFFIFFFLSFSAFPNLFWLGKKQQWCFLIFFEFFCYFFWISITGRVGIHWNDFFFFSLLLSLSQLIFSLSRHFPTYFASKRSHNSVFYFFGIFYYGSGRNSSERFFLFYFLSFLAIPNLFWLEKLSKCWFWIFLLFFF